MSDPIRCDWPGADAQMLRYHDEEWGVPLHDDLKLFEFIILDAFQAGLSWSCVLHKRENFRAALDGFDFEKIATYDEHKLQLLQSDASIIRNRAKLSATVGNAKAFIAVRDEFGSFDSYIWRFTDGRPLVNRWALTSQVPATSLESDAMSKDLKQRGFRFVGTTICYAFLQAAGMVNDHLTSCFRYFELLTGYPDYKLYEER